MGGPQKEQYWGKAGEEKAEQRPQGKRTLAHEASTEGSSACEPRMYSESSESQSEENSELAKYCDPLAT